MLQYNYLILLVFGKKKEIYGTEMIQLCVLKIN